MASNNNQALANLLMAKGSGQGRGPMTHWTQGLAQMMAAYGGKKMQNTINAESDAEEARKRSEAASLKADQAMQGTNYRKHLGNVLNGGRVGQSDLMGMDNTQANNLATFQNSMRPKPPKMGSIAQAMAELYPHLPRGTPEYAAQARAYVAEGNKAKGVKITNKMGGGQAPASTQYDKWQDGYDQTTADLAQLRELARVNARIKTGKLAGLKHNIRGIAASLGVEVDEDQLHNVDYFQTLALQFVMKQVQLTKGAVSEKEMALFEAGSPGLGKSPGGNAMIARMQIKIGEALQAQQLHMAEWVGRHPNATRFDADREARRYKAEFEATKSIFTKEEKEALQSAMGGGAEDPIANPPGGLAAEKAALLKELEEIEGRK